MGLATVNDDNSGGWFIFAITVIIPVCLVIGFVLLKVYKKKRAGYYVKQFAKYDPSWNPTYLKQLIRKMFIEVNGSWMIMNFSPILPKITEALKLEWIQVLKVMEDQKLVYNFSSVQIDNIEFVGAIDDIDNNKDEVKILISGYMRRGFRNSVTNELALGSSPGYDYFSDLYHFKRFDDHWYLNKIEYFADFGTIMSTAIKNNGIQPGQKKPGKPNIT